MTEQVIVRKSVRKHPIESVAVGKAVFVFPGTVSICIPQGIPHVSYRESLMKSIKSCSIFTTNKRSLGDCKASISFSSGMAGKL
jgi:hypothetical protein